MKRSASLLPLLALGALTSSGCAGTGASSNITVPVDTSNVNIAANLNAGNSIGMGFSTPSPVTIISDGKEMGIAIDFTKTKANTWDVEIRPFSAPHSGRADATLEFVGADGALKSTGVFTKTFGKSVISFDVSKITQFPAASSIFSLTRDGERSIAKMNLVQRDWAKEVARPTNNFVVGGQ